MERKLVLGEIETGMLWNVREKCCWKGLHEVMWTEFDQSIGLKHHKIKQDAGKTQCK